jgi:catechol 2,3-dioxygenase-like lactoylglutathione lyase family enzyme
VIDHFTLKVSDYARSKPFYVAALKPLGYAVAMEYGGGCGMGVAGKPDLWLVQDLENVRPMHFALHTEDRAVVDAFHEAALQAGGRNNGAPGLRKDYHPSYYAAFVLDPDGHNVEVVCHAPPPAVAKRIAKIRAAVARKAGAKAEKAAPRAAARRTPGARKGARRPRR